MPVVAVAAGAFAAAEIATVGIAAMSAFEVIAAVGAITSGIGALTGNEDLMKIGAVAGLAGGVGAFAQGKGWLATGNAANTAGAEASSLSNAKALTQTAAPGVETTGVTGVMGATEPVSGIGQTAGLPTDSIAQNLTASNPLVNPTEPANSLFDAPSADFNAKDALLERGAVQSPTNKGGSIFDTLKGFTDIFKDKDGKYDKTLLSMAGNFVGGIFDDEKNAKADYYKSAADTAKARLANASAVPNMGFKTKQAGSIFKPTSPTYNAPRPSGLFYAR